MPLRDFLVSGSLLHPFLSSSSSTSEEEVVVFTREKSRGIRLTRNTRNIDPFKPRNDESLARCHPYLWPYALMHITLPAPSRGIDIFVGQNKHLKLRVGCRPIYGLLMNGGRWVHRGLGT